MLIRVRLNDCNGNRECWGA